jgi:hypothetical protein
MLLVMSGKFDPRSSYACWYFLQDSGLNRPGTVSCGSPGTESMACNCHRENGQAAWQSLDQATVREPPRGHTDRIDLGQE